MPQGLHTLQRLGNYVRIPGKDTVIQVEKAQIKFPAVDGQLGQFLGKVMDGKGEQERPEGVTLLNASGRIKGVVSQLQVGVASVAPVGPFGQPRERFPTPLQELVAADGVEGVLKVKFHHALAYVVGMPLGPSPAGVNRRIHSQGACNTDLEGLKEGSGVLLDRCAKGFASETAQNLTHSNRSHATLWLSQSDGPGTGEKGSNFLRGLAASEQVNNFQQLFLEQLLASRGKGVTQASSRRPCKQPRRSGSRVQGEASESTGQGFGVNLGGLR